MEHIVVTIRPDQGPGVVSWALRHARACGGALEIIASGLEWADPPGALLGVGLQLIAAGSDVPFAMRTVAVGMPVALAQSAAGVDLVVLGTRSGRRDRAEAGALLAMASASACPVVIVPADWRADAESESAPVSEALAASDVEACIDRLRSSAAPIQIIPTSFVASSQQRAAG